MTLLHSGKSQETGYKFLEIANRHVEIRPMLVEFVDEFKSLTGCAAVGIRLLDDQLGIPYTVYQGFSSDFIDLESPLVIGADRLHVHQCRGWDHRSGEVVLYRSRLVFHEPYHPFPVHRFRRRKGRNP